MHYHLEVIIPPTDNVEEAIRQVLEPFSENGLDEDGQPYENAFYDYYVIGGRWNGEKILSQIGEERLSKFDELLIEKGVTVSSLQAGKRELNPKSQIPLVDQLWKENFPDSPIKVCPLFKHYEGDFGDIMKLKDIPEKLTASRVIIAQPGWVNETKLEAGYMVSGSIWNGVNSQETKWDKTIKTAIEEYKERLKHSREDWKEKCTPKPDWLCVTVDYHN